MQPFSTMGPLMPPGIAFANGIESKETIRNAIATRFHAIAFPFPLI
jgi:hypothetical protein